VAKAVLLFSGGIDSTVLLYMLLSKGVDVYSLFIDYGHKASKTEEKAVTAISSRLKLSTKIIRLKELRLLLPNVHNLRGSPFYYPYRNTLFITLAAMYAYALGSNSIFIGLSSTYLQRASFPNATRDFVSKMNELLGMYGHGVKVYAPLIGIEKSTIVRIGNKLGVPFHLTYSCYHGGEVHCGKCPACLNRKLAFRKAGINDPTIYAK